MTEITRYDFHRPEVMKNPYPYYAWLREHRPVYHNEEMAFWAVSRYEDVVSVLRNPVDFSSAQGIGYERTPDVPMMIMRDPPDHTRLRSLVSRAFTPKMVAQNQRRVQEIVDDLLDRVMDRGRFDLVEDLAYPLPVIVIAEMLGVEPERRDDFKRWSDQAIKTLGGPLSEEEVQEVERALEEFHGYFGLMVEQRRLEPKNDLITALVQAQEERDALSTPEIMNFCLLLLVAGNETTTNLIGNGALALFRNPDQAEKLARYPALAPSAVEEALRFESPIQGFFRTTARDVELRGARIPAGEKVMVLYASANRDPEVFADPDRFDIERAHNPHVAFGLGIHFCLGAPLARLEARLATETLLRRTKNMRPDPDGTIEYVDNPLLRGLKTLPVLFEPA